MMKGKSYVVNMFTVSSTVTVIVLTVIPGVVSATQFSDIQGNSHEKAIIELGDMGLIYGYPDGMFKPNKGLTNSDVVKLIGRYLRANGYEIPSDYKKKMRFSDLSSDSEEGLLQYAALVKDNGIFTGVNGNLSPKEIMNRENMAIVLVNALSGVHQFDFTTYVANQTFQHEVLDLDKAKVSARSAINVLDFYDLSKVEVFEPKTTLTRGQFATFLYKSTFIKTPNLTIDQVVVFSNNQLIVTLSDQSTHYITLTNPLKENILETVDFDIDGRQYSAEVKFTNLNLDQDLETPNDEDNFYSFKIESDELLLGISPDGKFTELDDADIKVFGLMGDLEVEIGNEDGNAYTISTESKYLNTDGKRVTANLEAIKADNIFEDKFDKYEAEILVTINETGETIRHTLTLTREEAKVSNSKFELIDRKSLSEKLLDDVDVELTASIIADGKLDSEEIFKELLEEGSLVIVDQYGNDHVSFSTPTGEVTFFDGTEKYIGLTITDVKSNNDSGVITSNGTRGTTINLGMDDGLTTGDSFNLAISIDGKSQTLHVYLK
ncbi:hypothetical protein JOD29_002326 [Lysinibacillus composti]|uniref:S-layer homology domain-containing protein n=1 Tax=Lysinibacillus composti TaxID=720633 RepID=A0A3N9UHD3_9BACI|nr:S-layer homology domain-containing protein [Lysinibacillus composti]MBM7609060.1 hypothetical protein [Lysinibacillus composti]RQW75519.1 S-layer homology domain-containing protein [Lysinibacillus composti]